MNPFSTPAAAAMPPLALMPAGTPLPNDRPRIRSDALFQGAVEIEIEHQQQVYRLRRTSLGKLILTK